MTAIIRHTQDENSGTSRSTTQRFKYLSVLRAHWVERCSIALFGSCFGCSFAWLYFYHEYKSTQSPLLILEHACACVLAALALRWELSLSHGEDHQHYASGQLEFLHPPTFRIKLFDNNVWQPHFSFARWRFRFSICCLSDLIVVLSEKRNQPYFCKKQSRNNPDACQGRQLQERICTAPHFVPRAGQPVLEAPQPRSARFRTAGTPTVYGKPWDCVSVCFASPQGKDSSPHVTRVPETGGASLFLALAPRRLILLLCKAAGRGEAAHCCGRQWFSPVCRLTSPCGVQQLTWSEDQSGRLILWLVWVSKRVAHARQV